MWVTGTTGFKVSGIPPPKFQTHELIAPPSVSEVSVNVTLIGAHPPRGLAENPAVGPRI